MSGLDEIVFHSRQDSGIAIGNLPTFNDAEVINGPAVSTAQQSTVPEPENHALMLGGPGLVGAFARLRHGR